MSLVDIVNTLEMIRLLFRSVSRSVVLAAYMSKTTNMFKLQSTLHFRSSASFSRFSLPLFHSLAHPSHLTLVLHHPDLALRNILFGKKDFTKPGGNRLGRRKFCRSFLPHTFSMISCPQETIHTRGKTTQTKIGRLFRTPLEIYLLWPKICRNKNNPVDLAAIGATIVRRYYFRQHFTACFSGHMHELYALLCLKTLRTTLSFMM